MMKPVIVGAGIGGLCAGALLALHGHPPLILEKEPRVGGRATSYSYRECILDNGWHASYFKNGCVGGTIGRILQKLGRPVPLAPLIPPLSMFRNGTIESVVGFRHVPEELRSFLVRCAAEIRSIPYEKTHEFDDITVHQWASQKTQNPLLLKHFNLSSYFAITAHSSDASAGEYFRVLQLATSLCEGLGYPVQGGIKTIADSLAEGICSLGGRILLGAEVVDMEVHGSVIGTVTYQSEGNLVEVCPDPLIFNPPVYSILDYINGREFPSAFFMTLQNLKGKNTGPSTQVYILIDSLLLQSHSLILLPEDADIWQPGEHCALFSPSLLSKDSAPAGHQLLLIAVPHTGKSAVRRAQEVAGDVIPGLDSHVVWTHSFITRVVDGLAKHVGLVGSHRVGVTSPLHNLFFVGDTVQGTGPGMELPADSALTCVSVLTGGEGVL